MNHNENLDHLLNQLDLDSALFHLRRIGFSVVYSPLNTQSKHHLRRYREDADEHEDILIQRNDKRHFLIEYAYQGRIVLHPSTITSWDEWVLFINPLKIRNTKRKAKENRPKEGSSKEEESSKEAKRLRGAEQ